MKLRKNRGKLRERTRQIIGNKGDKARRNAKERDKARATKTKSKRTGCNEKEQGITRKNEID